jgi:hypothetical protein
MIPHIHLELDSELRANLSRPIDKAKQRTAARIPCRQANSDPPFYSAAEEHYANGLRRAYLLQLGQERRLADFVPDRALETVGITINKRFARPGLESSTMLQVVGCSYPLTSSDTLFFALPSNGYRVSIQTPSTSFSPYGQPNAPSGPGVRAMVYLRSSASK